MSDMNVRVVIGAALSGSHTQALSTARKSIKDYATGIGAAIKQNRLFGAVMNRTEEQTSRLRARQQELNQQLSESRGRWIALGAAVYGASKMIKSAAAIEEQGLYLQTVINAPDKQAAVGRAMKHSRSFARKSLASQEEVLEIEYNLNSAGLSEEVARAGTELVHKLAKVTKGAPAEVGKIFATTFNNLGDSMSGTTEEKMKHIGDVLAETQFAFQLEDFNQLGQSMAYASSTIASAKINFEQSAAALGILNGAGMEAGRAGTSFAAVMRSMTKASDELGFSVVRGADGQMDLIATLEGLNESLDGMEIDEKNQKLQELFGDNGKDGLVPLLNQLDALKKGTDRVAKSNGSVEASYKTFLDSTSGQMTMFGQNMKMIGNVISGSVLPGLNLLLKPLSWLFGGIAWAIEKFPPLGWVIGGVTGAIVGMAAANMLQASAQWAVNAASLAWPGTWIIASVLAVGMAIGALVKNWDTVWSVIKKGGAVAWDFLKKMFAWTPLGLVMKAWGPALDFIGSAWEKIKIVGRFFGMGAGGGNGSATPSHQRVSTAMASVGAAATIAATPLPADLPAAARSGNTYNAPVNAQISIVQQPGQSGVDVAEAVDRKLKERERRQRSDFNGRLYD